MMQRNVRHILIWEMFPRTYFIGKKGRLVPLKKQHQEIERKCNPPLPRANQTWTWYVLSTMNTSSLLAILSGNRKFVILCYILNFGTIMFCTSKIVHLKVVAAIYGRFVYTEDCQAIKKQKIKSDSSPIKNLKIIWKTK